MLHKIFSGALLLTLFFIAQANAQPNSTTITPSLEIVQPITITKNTDKDLLFGKFAAYVDATGTVVLGTDGQRSKTGDITLLDTEPFGAAEFTVEGLPNATFSLQLPTTATLTNTLPNSNDEMEVSAFLTNISGTPTIGAQGSLTFNVGATLTKSSLAGRGIYTGTFSITVSYL
ncbi:MAG: hypothetical protein HBSAPP04_07550 [Ignavibacteriaceae bacterium]|nr:MAG: DUF4402 domain-containing protein [Chlorobiota bacterium]GJQ31916.1 MAG: hypothetical protein HBSAPP04_07550 [Ignavibacteriaceae bacterium]